MGANRRQVGGDHYRTAGRTTQHCDLMWLIDADYFTGCATKYLTRFHRKNGIEDLQKCIHFLDKMGEIGPITCYAAHAKIIDKWIDGLDLTDLPDGMQLCVRIALRGIFEYNIPKTRKLVETIANEFTDLRLAASSTDNEVSHVTDS